MRSPPFCETSFEGGREEGEGDGDEETRREREENEGGGGRKRGVVVDGGVVRVDKKGEGRGGENREYYWRDGSLVHISSYTYK